MFKDRFNLSFFIFKNPPLLFQDKKTSSVFSWKLTVLYLPSQKMPPSKYLFGQNHSMGKDFRANFRISGQSSSTFFKNSVKVQNNGTGVKFEGFLCIRWWVGVVILAHYLEKEYLFLNNFCFEIADNHLHQYGQVTLGMAKLQLIWRQI